MQGQTEAALLSETSAGAHSEDSAALAAARTLLEEEEDMQAVHSTKSVAALLKSAKDKIAQVKAAVQPPAQPPSEPRIANEVRPSDCCLTESLPLSNHMCAYSVVLISP